MESSKIVFSKTESEDGSGKIEPEMRILQLEPSKIGKLDFKKMEPVKIVDVIRQESSKAEFLPNDSSKTELIRDSLKVESQKKKGYKPESGKIELSSKTLTSSRPEPALSLTVSAVDIPEEEVAEFRRVPRDEQIVTIHSLYK